MKRFPDFFIVGAAKSGTTSLWEFLGKHPSIFMTNDIKIKELGYFSNEYGITNEEEYLTYFQEAKPNQLIGEACHPYLTSEEAASRIITANPDAKIIMILRNPVKRAYSLYNFMFMEGYEKINSFEEALLEEKKRINQLDFKNKSFHPYYRNYFYFNTGLYFEQVNNYYRLFRKDRCKVIIFEEFIKKPHDTIQEIESFLEIPHLLEDNFRAVNESKSLYLPKKQFYFRIDLPWKLMKLGFRKKTAFRISEFILKKNTRKKKPKGIDIKTYNELMILYKEDINMLSGLLGKDLTQIWK